MYMRLVPFPRPSFTVVAQQWAPKPRSLTLPYRKLASPPAAIFIFEIGNARVVGLESSTALGEVGQGRNRIRVS